MCASRVEHTHQEVNGPEGTSVSRDKTSTTTNAARDPSSAHSGNHKTTRVHTNLKAADVKQLLPNKQQLSYAVPVFVAIVLALLLLAYRGSFSWHQKEKTWTDHVSEGVQNTKEGLQEGLKGYYDAAKGYVADASVRGQGVAHDKLGEASDYLHETATSAQEKMRSAAESAHTKLKDQATAAASYAQDKAGEYGAKAKTAAADAYDSATDPSLLHRASEYLQDKAGHLLHRGKTLSAEAVEEVVHKKNIAQENVRHFAAEAELKAQEKLDSVKESANDLKRNVKSKVGL